MKVLACRFGFIRQNRAKLHGINCVYPFNVKNQRKNIDYAVQQLIIFDDNVYVCTWGMCRSDKFRLYNIWSDNKASKNVERDLISCRDAIRYSLKYEFWNNGTLFKMWNLWHVQYGHVDLRLLLYVCSYVFPSGNIEPLELKLISDCLNSKNLFITKFLVSPLSSLPRFKYFMKHKKKKQFVTVIVCRCEWLFSLFGDPSLFGP